MQRHRHVYTVALVICDGWFTASAVALPPGDEGPGALQEEPAAETAAEDATRPVDPSRRERQRPAALQREEEVADSRPRFAPDPLEPVLESVGYQNAMASLAEKINLELDFDLMFAWQGATDVIDQQQQVATGRFDITGRWQAVDDANWGRGTLGFLLEANIVIGNNQDERLGVNIGSLLGVNGAIEPQGFRGGEFWWRQESTDRRFAFTIGRLDQSVYFDINRVANDEMTEFFTPALVNNPAIPFPNNGGGFNLAWRLNDLVTMNAGIGDALARPTGWNFYTLHDGDFFAAFELQFSPRFGDALGQYRFLFWHNDTDTADGGGFALSFDQDLGGGFVPFLRYGFGEKDVTLVRQSVSGGVGIEGPFGYPGELIGVGAVWADQSMPGVPDETTVELFYRLQLTDTLQLTPMIQVLFNPAHSDKEIVGVFGARLLMTF